MLIKGKCMREPSSRLFCSVSLFALLLFSTGCSPRVEVAAPEKPITINLNVKIDHEVKIQVEKDLEKVFSEDSELFKGE